MADYRREAALTRQGVEAVTAWLDRHNPGGDRTIRTVLGATSEELLSDTDPQRERLAGLLLLATRLAVDLATYKQTDTSTELALIARYLEDR